MNKIAENEKQAQVPRLRFPEFRDVGEWKAKPLGKLSLIVRGGSPRPIDAYLTSEKNGLNWLKIGDVDKEAKYVYRTEEKVKVEALKKTREVNPGDLIMSNSMSFGRPYILKIKSCIHDGWIAVTEIHDRIDSDYLYYVILSNGSQVYFLKAAAGGGVKNLNADIIKLLPIPFPEKQEQQKIADCLSSLDALITAQAEKLDALKTHKKGLMQQLFPRNGETVPSLRFPEFRDSGKWNETSLKSVCDMQAGKFVSASEISGQYEDGLYPCYGGNGLRGYTKTFTHSGRYPLIGRQGALCGNIKLGVGQFHATEHALVVAPKQNTDIDWLYYNLDFLNLNKYATGQAQPGLSVDVLEQILVLVPKIEREQQIIAKCLSSIDNLIKAHMENIDVLKTHKKGLMQQLFPNSVGR
jgi:type I restriction enzyme, S subunit